MRIVTILVFALYALTAVAGPNEVYKRIVSEYMGTYYESVLTEADLSSAPAWKETDDYPPLPPRRAIHAAEICLTNLVNSFRPVFHRISLEQKIAPGTWVYIVDFEHMAAGGVDGVPYSFSLIVLMNGKVIPPINAGSTWPKKKPDEIRGEQSVPGYDAQGASPPEP